jgi:hypothetical protein
MTGESVECFNCGRPNPAWAQVCRSCGVPLVAARGDGAPSGPFPTDQASLTSMGAAVAAILVAVLFGVIFSNLNPTKVTVGFPTPSPSPSGSFVISPSFSPGASAPVAVTTTPVPTPALPGTITFGTVLDGATRTVSQPTDQFTPQAGAFAHSIAFAAPYGAALLVEEVTRVAGDGTEKIVQSRAEGGNNADPNALVIGYSVPVANVYQAWGTGNFVMRIYRGDEKVAEGTFTLNP